MNMTYRELQQWLAEMTPAQLSMSVTVYAGDVDDAIPVFGVCHNSEDEMGESIQGLDQTQPMMLI